MEISSLEMKVLLDSIRFFIEKAEPIGSKVLQKLGGFNCSSATLRNIMANLEQQSLLMRPYSSAGRVPTLQGFQKYIQNVLENNDSQSNQIMEQTIAQQLEQIKANCHSLSEWLDGVSQLLAQYSNELAVITFNNVNQEARFAYMNFVKIAEFKLMFIITLLSGFVHKVVLDLDETISAQDIQQIARLLNEHWAGQKLETVKEHFWEHLQQADLNDPVRKMFHRNLKQMFNFAQQNEVHLGGLSNVLLQPELNERERMSKLLDVIEKKERLLFSLEPIKEFRITLGEENFSKELKDFAVVSSTYSSGPAQGTLSIIGPIRMPYSRIIPLVQTMSRMLRVINWKIE